MALALKSAKGRDQAVPPDPSDRIMWRHKRPRTEAWTLRRDTTEGLTPNARLQKPADDNIYG
jgi:hypothetical protein